MGKLTHSLNIIFAITDTLIAALSILCFAYMAQYFERWWILLFSILPLVLYNQHVVVMDEQKGSETDGRE